MIQASFTDRSHEMIASGSVAAQGPEWRPNLALHMLRYYLNLTSRRGESSRLILLAEFSLFFGSFNIIVIVVLAAVGTNNGPKPDRVTI